MLKDLLRKVYRSVPGIHELCQIRTSLFTIQSCAVALTEIDASRFFDIELKVHPRYGDPKRLTAHEQRICSQNGEDGIIQEIFRRIGSTDKFFVELGTDGIECNTSFLLSQDWRGCWIDGNDRFIRAVANRPEVRDGTLRTRQAFITRESVDAIFRELEIPVEFDLLSIDIDQNTYYVWQGLQKFRPRVVIVEYNAAIPPYIDWKVEYDASRLWDCTSNYSASLKACELLGRDLGYSLIGCNFTGANAFFVRNDFLGNHFREPFTAENHYEPDRLGLLHWHLRPYHPVALFDRQRSSRAP